MKKRQIAALALLFFFIFVCNALSSVTFSLSANPKRLIPFLATDSASAEISSFIFNGLLKLDKNMKITGDLAKSYEIKNGGKTIIFHLRRNVKWSDGVDFSANDVIYTYKLIVDKHTATPYSGKYRIIKNIYAKDKYTVVVNYKYPFAPALYSWMMGIVPEHILKNVKDINTCKFNMHPVGTGPYILKEWKTSQYLILEANKNYFLGKPKINRIIYRIIPDGTTRFLELENGTLDMASLTPIQYMYEFNGALKKRYNVYLEPSSGYTFLAFNLREPLFKNIEIRKAIELAINREKIKDVILFKYGIVANSIYPINSPYFSKGKNTEYNPKKALHLLKKNGFTLGKDGYLRKDGRIFEFSIITNSDNPQRKYASIMIQEYLKRIGIKVDIRMLEWQAFIKLVNERHFDCVLLGWSLSSDPDEYSIWHSKSDTKGGFNFTGFNNKKVDKLIEEGRVTFDKKRRRVIYLKINRLITQEIPYIFLYYPISITVVNKRIKGIKPEKAGIMYNFIRWYEQ